MPEWDYHSLRHTHATMLYESGASLIYIQKRLGHKKVNITSDVYINHLTEAMQKQGTEVLEKMFK